MSAADTRKATNFLTAIIDADLAAGKNGRAVVTRFPPEPNGFLHIGHAKSVLLNFGLAAQYGGRAHLRFDDTNPATEDTAYVESIQNDVRWLLSDLPDWGEHLHFASDYFPKMYEHAVRLVKDGKAYVDTQPVEAIREQRGNFEKPGTNSPHRDRSVEENLALLEKMKRGELADGSAVLRAKIDMTHPNVIMRDPLLYRIKRARHHRTGDAWCIYPMYDYAHPIEDAIEGVTHSICTLEFESNRELYDWVLDNTGPWNPRPRQYEFARLALDYTVMSKRKLLALVNEKKVSGWDDPRMPTLAGMRRRGVTPEALREFCDLIGVAKNNSTVDIGKLEFAIRGDLEKRAPKGMAVLRPLRVTISNWPAEKIDAISIPWWPGEPDRGSREVPFGGEILIEQEDFSEAPPADWRRLAPGREVRLVGAYVIRCDEVVKNDEGEVTELRCSYDATSRGGAPADGRKIGGTLHWVHATKSVPAEVRLYDRLFSVAQPDAADDYSSVLNPQSLVIASGARVEPALAKLNAGDRVQFLRQGYFFVDPSDSKPGAPVFNRTIDLKDTWASKGAKPEAVAEARKPRAKKEEATGTSSPKKGRADLRAEQRAANPALAERFERYQSKLGLSKDDADILTADLDVAEYFDLAVASHANARSVARWLQNDLLGLAGDGELAALKIDGATFGKFVALIDDGKITGPAAKTLLAKLVDAGGDPATRMMELGLEKREDSGALAASIAKVLEAQAAEVARYRAGETKLLGVLLGAAMRATQGTADAASVKKALLEKLG